MKRKITELEQKLYDKGWKLTGKLYKGKYSQHTFAYEYEKEYSVPPIHYTARVFLDFKRENVIDYRVDYISSIVREEDIKDLSMVIDFIKSDIKD